MPAAQPAPGRAESAKPVLAVAGLDVDLEDRRGRALRLVAGADLELAAGETLGVLGESGCGKTTLARAILGILAPAVRVAGGSIRLDGRELVGLSERELARIRGRSVAMIFQEPGLALSPVLRVGEQVGDAVRLHLGVTASDLRRRVEELLAQVRFVDPARVYDAYPHQLSGGQLQRVVLARAIAGRPRVLLADEPTSAVDATVQREILAILGGLRRELGLAILFISHNPALLAQVCDRILVMYAGRVVEVGERDRILMDPLHPYTRALLACAPRADRPPDRRLATIAGAPPDPAPAAAAAACRFEPRCPDRFSACRRAEPPLAAPAPGRAVSCFLYED